MTAGEHSEGGDHILVQGLRVLGTHGVLPAERDQPQPFEIDLDLSVDLAAAGASDQLADTVDYGQVAECAASVVAGGPPHRLLESLAEAVAAATLAVDGRAQAVTVTVRKLEPPLSLEVAHVGVRIRRRR